jgi:perosamine synthetase
VPALRTDPRTAWLTARPTLPLSLLLRGAGGGRLPAPLDGDGVTLYAKGRNGIWHLVRALALDESEVVLVPSYNCGAEVDAVLRAPARVRFYRVDRTGLIDVDEFRRAIEPAARAAIVTHSFGLAQPDLSAVVDLCREHNLFLIEDCAHALYSTYRGRALGTFGDASVFSLWKTLPIPNGAAVVAQPPLPLNGATAPPPRDASFTPLRTSLEGRLLFRYGEAGRAAARISNRLAQIRGGPRQSGHGDDAAGLAEPSLNPHVTFYPSTANWSISPAAYRIACRSAHAEIAQRRRRNYAFLADELGGVAAARPLYPTLPTGACPLTFPLVVDDPRSLLRALEADRIAAEHFWSDFHPAFPADEFADSTYLKTHVVAVPIHQDLDPNLLARVVDTVRRWSRSR